MRAFCGLLRFLRKEITWPTRSPSEVFVATELVNWLNSCRETRITIERNSTFTVNVNKPAQKLLSHQNKKLNINNEKDEETKPAQKPLLRLLRPRLLQLRLPRLRLAPDKILRFWDEDDDHYHNHHNDNHHDNHHNHHYGQQHLCLRLGNDLSLNSDFEILRGAIRRNILR